ncbi:hypothetical protein [Lactiplantibacillus plantarum]|uniref:hypothetical protein n=1 Tax=Lactiplantibacillus plantarum TaxID=1590 RepID=UPI001F47D419|nr:hypothetical protein [Lactiplantibacillus plantarum]
MKKVYLRYQKQVDSFININKIMLMLEFVLLFVVKGSIDRYNQLPYDWFAYLTTLIHYFFRDYSSY